MPNCNKPKLRPSRRAASSSRPTAGSASGGLLLLGLRLGLLGFGAAARIFVGLSLRLGRGGLRRQGIGFSFFLRFLRGTLFGSTFSCSLRRSVSTRASSAICVAPRAAVPMGVRPCLRW